MSKRKFTKGPSKSVTMRDKYPEFHADFRPEEIIQNKCTKKE
jgi:hypothetical protein